MDYKQQFDNEMQKELLISFPHELSNDFLAAALIALDNESPDTMKCGYDMFENLHSIIEGKHKPSVFEASFIINAVTGLSFVKSGLANRSDYLALQKQGYDLAAKWNGIVTPIRERVSRKLQADANMPGRIIAPTSKHNLKSIKN
jgi:hypothetical protein